jgi:large subunit ribosomal protein L24
MAYHVKKGDEVQIIAGDHKGVKGRVLAVDHEKGRVTIQGHNLAKKHVKPSRRNPQGGRIDVEQPIHISNVLPVNTKTSKGSRVRFKVKADGTKKRVALDGTELGTLRRGK